MRNVFFSIAYSFLTTIGLFSNLTFAEVMPMVVTASPLTTPTPSNVITGEATDVTSSSATLNGTVYLLISTKWFEYGTISGAYDNSTRTTSVFPFAGTATVSIDICGLSAETTYYYRMAAYENTPGGPSFYPDAYGEERSFTTLTEITPTPTIISTQSPGLSPTVETGEVEVYETSAILNGTVNANELPTTTWFEYGTVSAAYTDVTSKQATCGSSNISVSIRTSKLPNTFFYRIVAQNSAGTTYGDERYFGLVSETPPSLSPTQSFTLSPTLTSTTPVPTPRAPTVVTGDASYDDETVVLGGTVNAHGLLTTAWFEYGTTTGFYSTKSSTEAVSGTSDTHVSISIGKILGDVVYYYRIAAQNSAGTSYGDERYFGLVSETPLPSSPTPSLALSPTPTSECKAKKIKVSSGVLRLKRGQSATVVISLKGEDCVPAGNTVTVTIGKIGSKRISVTPANQVTDENGQAVFTITAVKIGTAKVILKADSTKKSVIVRVIK